jgi:predicted dehydrogenase
MKNHEVERREFLQQAGLGSAAALVTAMAMAPGTAKAETIPPSPEEKPKHHIRFGVCGMSHDHIHGMQAAIQRGGGELVAAWGQEPDKLAAYTKRYPNVKMVKTQDEILDDKSIQLVLSSQVPSERAAIGIKAMKRGKDFLADKPGVITLDELAQIRKTIVETGRIYGILYSERLEVPAAVYAGELIKRGAIGKVVQTINLAPHQVFQSGGDAGGAGGRPDWFWNEKQFGGILCDIGSHQVDQFLFFTGSKQAEVVASQVANVHYPDRPNFQDFGDMMLRGGKGFGYVRLDWYTPKGLGTWGDGRLFVLGTDGYIEVRKYTNVAVSKQRNNLYIVDNKEARYIDCSNVPLPFGPHFVADVVNRTHTAQDQEMALLTAELSIKAQANAKRVAFST